jgi:hypothetical protein
MAVTPFETLTPHPKKGFSPIEHIAGKMEKITPFLEDPCALIGTLTF